MTYKEKMQSINCGQPACKMGCRATVKCGEERNYSIIGVEPNWISVKEKLPEIKEIVKVKGSDFFNRPYEEKGYRVQSDLFFGKDKHGQLLFVTHWMPLT